LTAELLLALVVAAGFTVEAAIGFGATLVILSLGSLVLPTEAVLARVVPINVLLSAAVVLRARRNVDLRVLGTRMLPAMLLGFPIGLYALAVLPPRTLTLAFAALVFVLSVTELWLSLKRRLTPAPPLSRPASFILLFVAGVAHGALASGGPPAVYVAARTLPDKASFRATLSALWLLLGTALTTAYVLEGRVTRDTTLSTFPLIPALAVGLGAGELLHRRVSERTFRVVVFVLLIVLSVALVVRG
jgi:uncharacterized membrane protein YfcA